MPATLATLVRRLGQVAGLDRAIFFTVLARVSQSLGSVVTVLLIVRLLSRVEQGYYYTLWSLVALQTLFELGFSFVVLQFAAHESAHLRIGSDGVITGDPAAHGRLASILRTIQRWYLSAALLMVVFLAPFGRHIFAARPATGVHWQGPWLLTVLAAAVMFQIDPTFSFLEGCGLVAQVARVRLLQSITGTAMAWTAMLTHRGLYSPAMVICGQALVGLGFLYTRRALLLALVRYTPGQHAISWWREIFPFQWRIAVSWLCAFIPNFLFTPLLFTHRGSIEAGQFGLSLNLVASTGTIALSWMSTKAASFGSLASLGKKSELDRLFSRTLRQSTGLLAACATLSLTGVLLLPHFNPRLASRMVAAPVFVFLLLAMLCNHIVQCEGYYLRAHKLEPFLQHSLIIATLLIAATLLGVRVAGSFGIAAGYFLTYGLVALASATLIFRRKRKQWRREHELA